MKHAPIKIIALLLSLAMMLSMFTACGSKQDAAAMDAVVDAAVKAALEAAVAPTSVTIVDTDGRHITIEDTRGKSLQQLLDQANISLNKNDFLNVDTDQMLSGNITVRVCRSCTVTVAVATENTSNSSRHTVMLTGGTVADAIAAANLDLGENYAANHALHELLTDGMEIIIYTDDVIVPEIAEEDEEDEETEPAETSSSNNSSTNNSSSNNTQPQPTEPKPTEPAPTEPAPTEPERTVVSVEVYEDCDGSGHGVKVITYSDGTQEEVYF